LSLNNLLSPWTPKDQAVTLSKLNDGDQDISWWRIWLDDFHGLDRP